MGHEQNERLPIQTVILPRVVRGGRPAKVVEPAFKPLQLVNLPQNDAMFDAAHNDLEIDRGAVCLVRRALKFPPNSLSDTTQVILSGSVCVAMAHPKSDCLLRKFSPTLGSTSANQLCDLPP